MDCMIRWEVTDLGVRVSDKANNELVIESPDWTPGGSLADIPRNHDVAISGRTSKLIFPQSLPFIQNLDDGQIYEFGNEIGPRKLPSGDYFVSINQNVKTFIRFEAAAVLSKTADFDTFTISFPEPIVVTLAFRSRIERPKHTVTMPPTTDGLARTIPYLATAHEMSNPNRSYFEFRRHPPLLELGAEFDAPPALASTLYETGIELVVPDDLSALFVAAPLAYYLQATVTVEERETTLLRAPAVGVENDLGKLPKFQHKATSLLKRVFWLDCLVRNEGPYKTDLYETRLLDEIGLDPHEAYHATPAERLHSYLMVPFELIENRLPEWHLSTYVKPVTEHVTSIPFLLNSLSFIYLPEISKLGAKEFMHLSLDDFYRGGQHRLKDHSAIDVPLQRSSNSKAVPTIELVKPELHEGRVHGWLADEIPIDVFKTIPESYQNRLNYLYRERDDMRVTVVLNDEDMDAEHETVEEIYRERSKDLPYSVSIHEHLTKGQLADVFEADNDFVHYIGHCEKSGLECSDGFLSVKHLKESNTQTFFLNACGSYYEGVELIRKGSVAGAVTFKSVLNKQAAKVGTAFARLMVNGFSIERAIQLARRRIMMGKDYAVVGDGTHVLTQCDAIIPSTMQLERLSDSSFKLVYEMFTARENGTYYQPYIKDNDQSYLFGSESTFTLDHSALCSVIERSDNPVIFEGEFYWAEELLDQLLNA